MKSIILENIAIPVSEPAEEALTEGRKRLHSVGIDVPLSSIQIRRQSIDARHQSALKFVYSLYVSLDDHIDLSRLSRLDDVKACAVPDDLPFASGAEDMSSPIAVIGFGPAGMFCALTLAENGYAPVVFERGSDIDGRINDTEKFLHKGRLNAESNIQFGAGGAGTFSDGKLTTRINDPLCHYVLRRFVDFGAPPEITWKAKPHVGTDILRRIVRNVDMRIRELGGSINYNARVSSVDDGSVTVRDATVPVSASVLAIGHSARDMYRHLMDKSFDVEPKAYSCGVRIEHLQSDVNRIFYGELAEKYGLPPAEYALSFRSGKRGVYSFCMCPGGIVVPSSSSDGEIVTNGMSYSSRDGKNANSALAVSVLPEDYGNTPSGAILFQESLERSAFRTTGSFAAPVQTVDSFLRGSACDAPGPVQPTYMDGNVVFRDLRPMMPSFMSDMLRLGLRQFDRKFPGFSSSGAILTGFETRTSSPVRIRRNDSFAAPGHDRIYPCGEGAGYAGGIMSAAIDGIRVAVEIMKRFKKPKDRLCL